MGRSTIPRKESISTSTPPHLLVRWSHWLNVPILLGLILSGISIYWSSPIYQHKPDPLTANFDAAADIVSTYSYHPKEDRDLSAAASVWASEAGLTLCII